MHKYEGFFSPAPTPREQLCSKVAACEALVRSGVQLMMAGHVKEQAS
jgi:hypothetical protein